MRVLGAICFGFFFLIITSFAVFILLGMPYRFGMRQSGVSETPELITLILVPLVTGYASGRVFLRWTRPPKKTGHCGNCGYNLQGNVSGVCPECGARLAR